MRWRICLLVGLTMFLAAAMVCPNGDQAKPVIKLLDYYPVGPKHSYTLLLMGTSFDWQYAEERFSETGTPGVFKANIRGHSGMTAYYLVAASGLYKAYDLADLKESPDCLFLPAEAHRGDKWVAKNPNETVEMTLVERPRTALGRDVLDRNVLGREGDFISIKMKLGSAGLYEMTLEKGKGPVAGRFSMKTGVADEPRVMVGYRYEDWAKWLAFMKPDPEGERIIAED